MGGMESCLLGYLFMLSRKGTLDICLLGIPLSACDFFAGDPPDGILHVLPPAEIALRNAGILQESHSRQSVPSLQRSTESASPGCAMHAVLSLKKRLHALHSVCLQTKSLTDMHTVAERCCCFNALAVPAASPTASLASSVV